MSTQEDKSDGSADALARLLDDSLKTPTGNDYSFKPWDQTAFSTASTHTDNQSTSWKSGETPNLLSRICEAVKPEEPQELPKYDAGRAEYNRHLRGKAAIDPDAYSPLESDQSAQVKVAQVNVKGQIVEVKGGPKPKDK